MYVLIFISLIISLVFYFGALRYVSIMPDVHVPERNWLSLGSCYFLLSILILSTTIFLGLMVVGHPGFLEEPVHDTVSLFFFITSIFLFSSTRLTYFRLMAQEKIILRLQEQGMKLEGKLTDQLKDLHQKEGTFNLVASSIKDGVAVMDLQEKIVFWNAASERMFGYTKKEVDAMKAKDFLSDKNKDILKNIKEHAQKNQEQESPIQMIEGKRKNGEEFLMEVSLANLHGDDENESFVVAVMRDITERNAAERSIENMKEILERAQEVAKLGSWHLDIPQNILTWSKETYRIFGIENEESMTLEDFIGMIHPQDQEMVLAKWDAAMKGESYDVEHRIVADGKIKWVHEMAEIDFDKEGKAIYGLGTVHDITEQKIAEQNIHDMAELQSRFISIFTHVTRTPLNRIRWTVENVLEEEIASNHADHVRALREVLISEQELLHVIGNMSLALKVKNERLNLYTSLVSLDGIVRNVMHSYENACALKGLDCKVIVKEKEGFMTIMDEEKIRRVIEILVDNAISYSEEGGKIRMKLKKDESKFYITVEDEGAGISETEREFIGTLFYRGSNASKYHPNGTGVALFIAKAIMKKHEGDLKIESTEGEGTKMTISLPIKR